MKHLGAVAGILLALVAICSQEVAAQDFTPAESPDVRRIPAAWIGLSFRSSPPPESDVIVEDVVDGAPAERAGVLAGDRIVGWNGRTDVAAAIRATTLQAGDSIRIRVRREGERERDLTVVADRRPAGFAVDDAEQLREALAEMSRRLRIQGDSLMARADSLSRLLPRFHPDELPAMDSIFSRRMFVFPSEADSILHGLEEMRVLDFGPPAPFEDWRAFADSARSLGFEAARHAAQAFPPARAQSFADSLAAHLMPAPGFALTIAGARSAVAGAELTDLGTGLADYFGVERGVLVLRVAPDTPADRSGLREGDVIVDVQDEAISAVSDLRRLLVSSPTGGVEMRVMRHGVRQTITIGR
jgi:S1-C subfamily serine protease